MRKPKFTHFMEEIMPKKDKPRYKITNWAKYNETSVNRGDLIFWTSDKIIQKSTFSKNCGEPTGITLRKLRNLPNMATN